MTVDKCLCEISELGWFIGFLCQTDSGWQANLRYRYPVNGMALTCYGQGISAPEALDNAIADIENAVLVAPAINKHSFEPKIKPLRELLKRKPAPNLRRI